MASGVAMIFSYAVREYVWKEEVLIMCTTDLLHHVDLYTFCITYSCVIFHFNTPDMTIASG